MKLSGLLKDIRPFVMRMAPPFDLAVLIDGGGAAITTGIKCDVRLPFTATLIGWALFADQTGSVQVDVWQRGYVDFPPTNTQSICNGHEPAISNDTKAEDRDLSDWSSVKVTVGDVLRINVDSCDTIQRLTLSLTMLRGT